VQEILFRADFHRFQDAAANPVARRPRRDLKKPLDVARRVDRLAAGGGCDLFPNELADMFPEFVRVVQKTGIVVHPEKMTNLFDAVIQPVCAQLTTNDAIAHADIPYTKEKVLPLCLKR
jgi:hypothetical protein